MAVSTTLTSGLAEYIRVRKIEMWGPPASTLIPVTVACDWTGSTSTAGVYGKSVRISDTSIGSTSAAHISTKPPKDAQISQWLSSASTITIASLTYPVNTVVDLVFDMIINDSSLVQQQRTVAGAVQGVIYTAALDYASNGYLVPVALPTI